MRVVAVLGTVIACGAWALAAFVYAAWADIEGLSEGRQILAGVAVAALGIGCLAAALQGGLAGRAGRTTVMLVIATVAFAAWLAIAVEPT